MTQTYADLKTPSYPDHLNQHEMLVIDAIIRDALVAGCTVSVYDGEEWAIKRSADYSAITAQVAATDETTLRIRQDDIHGVINLIHGNLPSEVIADHTDTPWMRKILARANDVAVDLERRGF